MMDWNGGMDGGAWVLMTVFWVILIAAVVWALVSLFPGRDAGGADAQLRERPEEILDRRLVRGEIDAATYDELRAKLGTARAERM